MNTDSTGQRIDISLASEYAHALRQVLTDSFIGQSMRKLDEATNVEVNVRSVPMGFPLPGGATIDQKGGGATEVNRGVIDSIVDACGGGPERGDWDINVFLNVDAANTYTKNAWGISTYKDMLLAHELGHAYDGVYNSGRNSNQFAVRCENYRRVGVTPRRPVH